MITQLYNRCVQHVRETGNRLVHDSIIMTWAEDMFFAPHLQDINSSSPQELLMALSKNGFLLKKQFGNYEVVS